MAMKGEVVKLDRKFPLVEVESGARIRCQHATELVKNSKERAVIGDIVEISVPDDHDVGVIANIMPRRTVFVRRDPQERETAQVLAANFDQVLIVQPIDRLNLKRLERELVLAHETGAQVAVLLTKADLAGDDSDALLDQVKALAGSDVDVLVMSKDDATSVERVRKLVADKTTILIGKSGVGKSTLVNILLGENARATGDVRSRDGKGRHTTVSREILTLPDYDGELSEHVSDKPITDKRIPGGRIVDMPGVRGLGLWDAEEGIGTAFSDIESLAEQCRFRDCKHGAEPGCAVRAAVEQGELSPARLESYLSLRGELSRNNERRRRASWKNK